MKGLIALGALGLLAILVLAGKDLASTPTPAKGQCILATEASPGTPMYRHLLVPIDATDLSVEVVGNAVGLARSLGARITFFHAAQDPSASLFSDAEVVRTVSPEKHAYAYAGKARELLAKAEAAAHAFSVPCDSMQRTSAKPAAAIIDAARETSCDLIFMALHGWYGKLGMVLASETSSVLTNSGLPVLVAATGDRSIRRRIHRNDPRRASCSQPCCTPHDVVVRRTATQSARCASRARDVRSSSASRWRSTIRRKSSTVRTAAERNELRRRGARRAGALARADRQLVLDWRLKSTSTPATDGPADRAGLVWLEDAVNCRRFHVDHLGREEGRDPSAAQC